MSLVLWNAGLIGTLRRYGEFGVRLAIGEDKGHVYRSLLAESLMIGVAGLGRRARSSAWPFSYYLQVHGHRRQRHPEEPQLPDADRSCAPRSRRSPSSSASSRACSPRLIGTAIAGRAIYKRQTARLFKELET